MAEPEGFFARWSRLKKAARQQEEATAGRPSAAAPAGPPPSEPPPELPPIESLTAESDYSAFMRPDVPEALRQAALRKLWRSDPVYANLDGLLEYGEDYAAQYRAATGVAATVYRVLEGMPDRGEPAAAEPPDAAAGEPAASPPAEAGEAATGQPAASDGRSGCDGVT